MSTIKAIRQHLKLTQAALGEVIGCTQANVWHYENSGQTMPPDAAKCLIDFAATKGLILTLEQLYGFQPLPAMEQTRSDEVKPATKTTKVAAKT
jgi:putative transcriptional regulator